MRFVNLVGFHPGLTQEFPENRILYFSSKNQTTLFFNWNLASWKILSHFFAIFYLLAANWDKYLMVQIGHLLCNLQGRQSLNALLARRLKWHFVISLAFEEYEACTFGNDKSDLKSTLTWSGSSLVINLSNWEAALCSAGSRLGLYVMSSRNSIVIDLRRWSSSKS